MENSKEEESILTLFKGLSEREEKVLKMYFGLGGNPKYTLEKISLDFDLTVENVLQIKNDGIRELIKMIVSTEEYPISIPDGFLESADSDFFDNFMKKFVGSN